ncbi:unnamed protein product, partial [Symbiodinium pilosum]
CRALPGHCLGAAGPGEPHCALSEPDPGGALAVRVSGHCAASTGIRMADGRR